LNGDVYTRRSFEIPACKSVMLSERTSVLVNYFEEDVEAFYFSSVTELLSKVSYLLNNDNLLQCVSENAFKRSINSGYSLKSQTRKLLDELQRLN
jgi:spore maturation protein CgeB